MVVEEAADDTIKWWKDLPPHVAAVYYNPTFDQITQTPVFVHLLRQFQCPGVDTLQEDLEQGFATRACERRSWRSFVLDVSRVHSRPPVGGLGHQLSCLISH